MKVIKHGKKNFVAVCARCGCKFSYTINELKAQYPLNYIRCPECGDEYYHPSQATTLMATPWPALSSSTTILGKFEDN